MTFEIKITIHPNTYIQYPKLKDFVCNLEVNQCIIKRFDCPEESQVHFNLAYLDMYFDHESIENYLIKYMNGIENYKSDNKTSFFKLRLLLSSYDYDQFQRCYQTYHSENIKPISFEKFTLESLGYHSVSSLLHIQFIKIEDIFNLRRHLSGYAMSYFYYINHGRF
jgi:hypothetical protein